MLDCRRARDIIARQALGDGPDAEDDQAHAQAHIAGCAACRDYLARFSRSILSSDPDEVTCSEVRAQIDKYPAGGAGPGIAAIRAHLERCPQCSAEVATWQRVMALSEQGALAIPPRYPVFDLSFLPQPVDVWEQVRSTVRRLSYEIPATLALMGQALVSPPSLAVSYAPVQAARRGLRRKGKENLVTLSVDDRQQDVRISLDVTEAEKALWLAVSLRLVSSGQVIGGARVALCDDKGQPQEIKTVRSGEMEVRFPDIAPGHYLIRIESSGKTWELPVSL